MAPHSSTLPWKTPWTEEPGRLQSMGSLRVGHDCATSLSLFTLLHWRKKWQPTPVFLPGESQGRGSLVGCSLWGRTELDMTEVTQQQQQQGCSGPVGSPGSHPIPALPTGESLSNSVLAAKRGCSFTCPSCVQGLLGRRLPGYGAHLGRHPAAHGAPVGRPLPEARTHLGSSRGSSGQAPSRARGPPGRGPQPESAQRNHAQSPSAEHPQPTCWSALTPEHLRAGPELRSSSSWPGL